MSDISSAPPDFRALFDEHVAFVWRALKRHGVPESDLDDLCQEVFLVVHRRLPEFRGGSSLRTWLYGISLRVAAASRRKVRRTRECVEASPPDAGYEPDPLQGLDNQTRVLRVEQAMATLSEEKREAFALYELEHMSLLEVAQALGVPENTALYRLHAARAEIRAWVMRAEMLRAPRQAAGSRSRPMGERAKRGG